jgi:hypothetical protein
MSSETELSDLMVAAYTHQKNDEISFRNYEGCRGVCDKYMAQLCIALLSNYLIDLLSDFNRTTTISSND